MADPRDCVATGDPDLHECICPDCCEDRRERDELDYEMNGDPDAR